MDIKKGTKLFISISLLFFLGFILVLFTSIIYESIFSSRTGYFSSFIILAVFMILWGILLSVIFNWKYLSFKKSFFKRKNSKESIIYLKQKGIFVIILTVLSLFATQISWRFMTPILTAIDNQFFSDQSHYFYTKFIFVADSFSTVVLILIMLLSYFMIEILFSNNI